MTHGGDYIYRESFHDYARTSGDASAGPIIELVKSWWPVHSVLDVGCSRGTWLRRWQESGASDLIGIDGEPARSETLDIDEHQYRCLDLAKPFDLHRRFDLVQCLEVAEHLPPKRGPELVKDLVRHGALILFSAAPPGQGGDHHINERPYEYWRELFSSHGYNLYDALRPRLRANRIVSPWYRYNLFLYIDARRAEAVPEAVRQYRIESAEAIPDLSPWHHQLRKHIFRRLPPVMIQRLCRFKSIVKSAALHWKESQPAGAS